MGKSRKPYPEEFRREMVNLVRSGRTPEELGRKFDPCAEIVEGIRVDAPDGVDHIVEVAFHANITADEKTLRLGGSIAAYATGDPTPTIPFWPLVFKNVRLFFLGSDDFPAAAKAAAARGLNEIADGEWPGFEIEERFPLESIAEAHEALEEKRAFGRVVVNL